MVVLKKDDFGLLMLLSDSDIGEGGEIKDIVYVNPYSVRGLERIGSVSVENSETHIPTFFFGASWGFWTIDFPDAREIIRGSEATYEELIGRGFIQKVLWDVSRIEARFDGSPLDWDSRGL